MKVYHNEEFIGCSLDTESAWDVIKAYLDVKRYNPYYYRSWEDKGVTTIDYGSHTDFFYLKED